MSPRVGKRGITHLEAKLCNGCLHLGESCQAQYSFVTMGRAAEYRANGGYEAWERSADYVLVPLALIFLAVLLIPLAVHLTPQEQAAFLVANILIWVAFAVDYFVRLYLAPARGRFVRTHVLDFIVVCVPFLRPLRLLRVIGIAGEYVVRSRRHLARRAMAFVGVVAVVAVSRGLPSSTTQNAPTRTPAFARFLRHCGGR